MEQNKTLTIIVEAVQNLDNGYDISVGFPKGQPKVTIKESIHLLTAGICLLIKAAPKLDYKDFELMEDVIKHLNTEFISTKNDAKLVNGILE